MSKSSAEFMSQAWYSRAKWLYLLFPLAMLYSLIIFVRKLLYRLKISAAYRSELPVVVVGNITLGGTGKSPLVAYLVESLRAKGFKPGVASRGYGSSTQKHEVREVLSSSLVSEVGDEPLMLKLRVDCPIFVSPSRKLAVQALEKKGCDIVITDDGLQHYALERDIEICVFDAQRQYGNGYVLPVGPLREPLSRVVNTDFVVVNGRAEVAENEPSETVTEPSLFRDAIRMDLKPGMLKSLNGEADKLLSSFDAQAINAVAAIGNPERFFKVLERHVRTVHRHAFDDHHAYEGSNFAFSNKLAIIMTEKDAVKCRSLNLKNAWYLPVSSDLSDDLCSQVVSVLKDKGFKGKGFG